MPTRSLANQGRLLKKLVSERRGNLLSFQEETDTSRVILEVKKMKEFLGRVGEFKEFKTASGPIKVPALYTDVTSMWAAFPASARKVREILPSDKLKPIMIGRDKTIYGITAFEYIASTLGPYNEVGTAVFCRYKPPVNLPFLPALFFRAFKVGFWVHHLPVTTKIACDAGVDIWGYPKFYKNVEIKFEETELVRRCILYQDKKHILTFEIKKGRATKPDRWDWYTYTVKDGALLKTTVNSKGMLYSSKKADAATLTLGDHEMAREIEALGIEPKCLRMFYYPEMQTILNAGGTMEILRARR